MTPLLKHLPIVALAAVGAIGLGRAALYYRRGVRVVVVDRQRSSSELALELALLALLVLWVYLAIDYATGRGPRWLPAALDAPLATPWPAAAQGLGATLLAAGVVLYGLAVAAMGDSWRMGIDRQAHEAPSSRQPATLVTRGVFAWSRNPIYLAFDLLLAGTFLVHGRLAFAAAGVALATLLHLQILREERFLAACYGERFADYRRRVGRYGPWA